MAGVDLTGRHIVITGAGGGIGRAAALAAARAGAASLTLVDRDAASADATAALLDGTGAQALVLRADVTSETEAAGYAAAAVERFGRIDGFFNNAGIEGAVGPIAELDPADFDRVIAVNLRGVFLGLRYVLPIMISQGSGAVVCTGSLASERGLPFTAAYNASKHAVLGLVRTAAAEVGAAGVRVNCVEPGMIRTRMLASLTERLQPGVDVEEGMEAAGRGVSPIPRAGSPEEVADVVAFLLSEDARYVTGAALPVDGGALAVMGNAG